LPDLTQGIPSTLDAELREARSRRAASTSSLNITEGPSEPTPGTGGRGTEGLPKSAYISSHEQKKNNIIKYVYLITFGSLIGYTVYLGRDWDSEEEAQKHPEVPSGWGVTLFYNRVKARLSATLNYYNEPAFPKLLPKHDPTLQPPMTLVLSLEDLLIHQEWTRERGWRIAKRPGVDYFLRYLSQYYELVLFTTQPSSMADQVIRKLDPYRIIQWPLFREATLYKDGGYIKVCNRSP
jgi:import inner membrane translocase subunit TIM50